MNTALVGAGDVSVRPVGHSTLVQRISRRTGLALVAWSRSRTRSRSADRYSREELAELHERRLVAEQLREERFRAVAVGRMV
jgi:hypothetical protein